MAIYQGFSVFLELRFIPFARNFSLRHQVHSRQNFLLYCSLAPLAVFSLLQLEGYAQKMPTLVIAFPVTRHAQGSLLSFKITHQPI